MRIYDPRVGRFLSVDPLTRDYPWYTPYQYAGNSPIANVDIDGERKSIMLLWDESGKKATLTYWKTEDFTETSTSWTPTLTDWFKTTTKTVKNPRVEYVIHGRVEIPKSADGMFDDEVRDVTWTFASSKEMFGKEEKRREYYASGGGGWRPSNDWSYASSDQRWRIAGAQVLSYSIEAQAEKSIYSPNIFSGVLRVLSKSDRLKIFAQRLSAAQAATNQKEAINLINKTLDAVEDEYSGIPKAKGIPNRDDGRMYGILDDKYVKTLPDGTKIADTKGNRIILGKDGSIEIRTKDGTKTLLKKSGAQNQ